MGQQHSVFTRIEIASSPETVRAVFLDWQDYASWNQRWTLTPLSRPSISAIDLQPGDTIKVDMNGTVFRPTIVENSPTAFKWLGSLYGLFDGQHEFHWKKSEITPGGTTLIQKEDFTGPLTWFVREGSSGAMQTEGNFEKFNSALKEAAERKAKA